ncbi:MAG: hypothetical protein R3E41_14675 [Burkholderiaceae bacterium]
MGCAVDEHPAADRPAARAAFRDGERGGFECRLDAVARACREARVGQFDASLARIDLQGRAQPGVQRGRPGHLPAGLQVEVGEPRGERREIDRIAGRQIDRDVDQRPLADQATRQPQRAGRAVCDAAGFEVGLLQAPLGAGRLVAPADRGLVQLHAGHREGCRGGARHRLRPGRRGAFGACGAKQGVEGGAAVAPAHALELQPLEPDPLDHDASRQQRPQCDADLRRVELREFAATAGPRQPGRPHRQPEARQHGQRQVAVDRQRAAGALAHGLDQFGLVAVCVEARHEGHDGERERPRHRGERDRKAVPPLRCASIGNVRHRAAILSREIGAPISAFHRVALQPVTALAGLRLGSQPGRQ